MLVQFVQFQKINGGLQPIKLNISLTFCIDFYGTQLASYFILPDKFAQQPAGRQG